VLAEVVPVGKQCVVGLEFRVLDFGGQIANVIFAFLVFCAMWWGWYMSLTIGTTSGAYF